MYKIVYVLVDDKKLVYYNELMKSIWSLKYHMPNQEINVITDKKTYNLLCTKKTDIFDYAKVIKANFNLDNYNQFEKSRILKLSVRNIIDGDFLYLDTDTIICKHLPKVFCKKSIAAAFDGNLTNSDINKDSYAADLLNNWCTKYYAEDFKNLDHYYNSGVIWSKDDKYSKDFYNKWLVNWKNIKNKTLFDQASFNYTILKMRNHFDILDGAFNTQIYPWPSYSINYLVQSYIIHYFHPDESIASYKFAQKKYRKLPYNNPTIIKMLKDPKRQFLLNCMIYLEDSSSGVFRYKSIDMKLYKEIRNTYHYWLLLWLYNKKRLFKFNEKILKFFFKLKRK